MPITLSETQILNQVDKIILHGLTTKHYKKESVGDTCRHSQASPLLVNYSTSTSAQKHSQFFWIANLV